MTFDQIVRIAEGYSELGMLDDALEELGQLDAEQQDRVEVLRMRVDILLRKQEWEDALGLSLRFCDGNPSLVGKSGSWACSTRWTLRGNGRRLCRFGRVRASRRS